MKTSKFIFLSALVGASMFSACQKDTNHSATYYGMPVPFGNGTVRSFVEVNKQGDRTSIGLRITEGALNGLPTDTVPGMPGMPAPGSMITVDLPPNEKSTGFDHIMVNWNVYGHDPKQVYGVPHFDLHFYQIGQSDQNLIMPGVDMTPVNPQYVPHDYFVPVPIAVPMMGVHWFDTLSPEFHGVPFTSTFIYGSYHGKYIFYEPMITKAFLLSHPDYSAPVKQPAAFQDAGSHPTSYQVQFDNTQHEYVIRLAGLKKQ